MGSLDDGSRLEGFSYERSPTLNEAHKNQPQTNC